MDNARTPALRPGASRVSCEEAPSQVIAAKRAAREFVDRVQAMLVELPVAHAAHIFWTRGVAAWVMTKTADGNGIWAVPPELNDQVAEAKQQLVEPSHDPSRRLNRFGAVLGRKDRLNIWLRRIDVGLLGVPMASSVERHTEHRPACQRLVRPDMASLS